MTDRSHFQEAWVLTVQKKELKAAGFKKDADGIYTYTSKKIKDDTIKAAMADGESVSEFTLERAVDESSTSTGNAAANTSASTAAGSATTTASDSSSGAKQCHSRYNIN